MQLSPLIIAMTNAQKNVGAIISNTTYRPKAASAPAVAAAAAVCHPCCLHLQLAPPKGAEWRCRRQTTSLQSHSKYMVVSRATDRHVLAHSSGLEKVPQAFVCALRISAPEHS